jgi:hypothetical protein
MDTRRKVIYFFLFFIININRFSLEDIDKIKSASQQKSTLDESNVSGASQTNTSYEPSNPYTTYNTSFQTNETNNSPIQQTNSDSYDNAFQNPSAYPTQHTYDKTSSSSLPPSSSSSSTTISSDNIVSNSDGLILTISSDEEIERSGFMISNYQKELAGKICCKICGKYLDKSYFNGSKVCRNCQHICSYEMKLPGSQELIGHAYYISNQQLICARCEFTIEF